MNYREQLQTNGYVVIKSLFSKEELDDVRQEIICFKTKTNLLSNASGYTIPDFIKRQELEKSSNLKESAKLLEILKEVFGGNDFRFCAHNDIGINRVVGWHKDKLNGQYASYERVPIWSEYEGQTHEIVKVLVYLQDHSHNRDGLTLVPKSHITSSMDTKTASYVPTEYGDVVIFDQRITHRGMEKQTPETRILLSFGFGKNNIFTDQFERGTIARQNDQNK